MVLKTKNRFDDLDAPADNVHTYVQKHIYPVIRYFHAFVHGVEVEQANAKARGKAQECNSCKHIKCIEPWICGHDWHNTLIVSKLSFDINQFFVKFS